MRDLTGFEKGQIVGARIAGASFTKTAELFGFSRATMLRTTPELKKHGKTPSNQSNSGRTAKFTNIDQRALKRILGRKHRTTDAKVTAECN